MALSSDETVSRLEASLAARLAVTPSSLTREMAEALATVGNPDLDDACEKILVALSEQDAACDALTKPLRALQNQSSKRSSGSR